MIRAWSPDAAVQPTVMKTIRKHPLDPRRVRRVPARFSWVDHRLVRQRLLSAAGVPGSALYLFLAVVGDERGLSYYSDGSVGDHLGMDAATLREAREALLRAGLIAWEAPLYQVLALDGPVPQPDRTRSGPGRAQAAPPPAGQQAGTEESRAESLRLAETLSEILKGGAR